MSFEDLESGRPLPTRGEEDPSQTVAAGIFQINTAVSTFQRLVNALGTPKDTPELREKLHKTQQHIRQLVKETSAKFKTVSEADQHAKSSKKIADAKLAKDFQAILKEFQKARRLAAERKTAYAPCVPQAVRPSRQDVMLLDNEIMLKPEEQRIQDIQQEFGEMNEIYKDLEVLIQEKEFTVADNINNLNGGYHAAATRVKTQLAKAATSKRPNSSLACLLLVIFCIVLLIVITVLAG